MQTIKVVHWHSGMNEEEDLQDWEGGENIYWDAEYEEGSHPIDTGDVDWHWQWQKPVERKEESPERPKSLTPAYYSVFDGVGDALSLWLSLLARNSLETRSCRKFSHSIYLSIYDLWESDRMSRSSDVVGVFISLLTRFE